MPARHPLQDIKSFPSLVKYLRDELDWPIETESFEDLTFDFAPEELGLKPDEAAKVRDIKQLRPLVTNQPWGIFFVNFEPKRLPVVALRKILGNLVIKKRKTAKSAERAAWSLHDLLFISAFGEGEDRQITLAHFSEGTGAQDIPTLKVLGWDELDTQLNLQHVDRQLHDKLRWPATPNDLDAWRKQWSAAFLLRHRHAIATAQELAERLAILAQSIRQKVNQVLDIETEAGALRKLYAAFCESLIHDMTEDDFADMYAQTITYGLFSAAVSRTTPDSGTVVLAENLADMVPITNPFLREMLSTFLTVGGRKGKLDFDELGIQEVVEVLNSSDTNLTAVVRNFGDRRQGEDPVIHFYEDFLKQYDKKRKVERGVFYTPQPVVSYIVRSVHELLQTEFGLEDGLASTVTWGEMVKRHGGLSIPKGAKAEDPFVVILDPATGTAMFLVEVIDVIHRTMTEKWKRERLNPAQQRDAWNRYVAAHLLPRLYGYELMMAPYAIAHMKIGLKLGETGYQFQSNERARIYLTNSLEPASDLAATAAANLFEALGHEAQAVNGVKTNQRFTVVIGNPPYSVSSWNNGSWIAGLAEDYKRTVRAQESQIQSLSNDYIKFLRFCEWHIEQSHVGVLAMITGHGYLHGTQPRDMRKHLIATFECCCCLDLHGSIRRVGTDARDDEPVFQITTGVAIIVAFRTTNRSLPGHTSACSLTGPVERKFEVLRSETAKALHPVQGFHTPTPPNYYFAASTTAADISEEYHRWMDLPDMFGTGNRQADKEKRWATGFASQQDDLAMSFTEAELKEKMSSLANSASFEQLQKSYRLCTTDQWNYSEARVFARGSTWQKSIGQVSYRPFDRRWTVLHKHVLTILRRQVMSRLTGSEGQSLGLISSRAVNDLAFAHCFVTREPVDKIFISSKTSTNAYVFPLFVVSAGFHKNDPAIRTPNFSRKFLVALRKALKIPQADQDFVPTGITANDIFNYIYAVLHSPGYRSRYAEFLKIDFPRVPLTGNVELFRSMARHGDDLVALHLLESTSLDAPRSEFVGSPRTQINRVAWCNNTVWIDAPACKKGASQQPGSTGFQGVSEAVWNFQIGGYQVCEKWLKDRKGRTLSADERAHYQKIIVALSETIRLMAEIEKVIDQYGGWPDAFITEPLKDSEGDGPGQLPFA